MNLLADCIQWALDHGYNPFDSTTSLPARHERLYGALNEQHQIKKELLAALELMESWATVIKDEDSRVPMDIRLKTQAAIAKAEGKK